jgi:hypothetical protein
MAVLIILGYGDPQPWYMTVVDCVAALGMTAMYVGHDGERKRKGTVEQDRRRYPAGLTRTKWFVCYLGLAILTSLVLLWQVQHLPQGVHENSEQPTTPMMQ